MNTEQSKQEIRKSPHVQMFLKHAASYSRNNTSCSFCRTPIPMGGLCISSFVTEIDLSKARQKDAEEVLGLYLQCKKCYAQPLLDLEKHEKMPLPASFTPNQDYKADNDMKD